MPMENYSLTELNDLSYRVIGAAMEVHDYLGPGLLESMYEECFLIELRLQGIQAEAQRFLHINYKGEMTKNRYRLDVLVEGKLLVEIKACKEIKPIDMAQTITYLKLSKLRLGLIINFNVLQLRHGIKRVIHDENDWS